MPQGARSYSRVGLSRTADAGEDGWTSAPPALQVKGPQSWACDQANAKASGTGRGRRPTPPSFQPISLRSRGSAPDDVRGVARFPPLSTSVSGFYWFTSGSPRLWKVWARIALSAAPGRIQEASLVSSESAFPDAGSSLGMSFVCGALVANSATRV